MKGLELLWVKLQRVTTHSAPSVIRMKQV